MSPRTDWMNLRKLARAGARLLPGPILARIAPMRYGYTGSGRRFDVAVAGTAEEPIVTIDGRLRLRVTPDVLQDLAYHFIDNGDSRDEIGTFLDTSASMPVRGALLLDVGAHKGLFSLVHCAAGEDRRAVLYEPAPSLAAESERLIHMNGWSGRASVRPCGVSDRPAEHWVMEDTLGFARIVPAGTAGATPVAFTTIDEECRRLCEMPQIIKVDVEGAEAEVLRGANNVLRSAKPILFLELHLDLLEQRQNSLASLLDPLSNRGYRLYSVRGRRMSRQAIKRSLKAVLRIVAR